MCIYWNWSSTKKLTSTVSTVRTRKNRVVRSPAHHPCPSITCYCQSFRLHHLLLPVTLEVGGDQTRRLGFIVHRNSRAQIGRWRFAHVVRRVVGGKTSTTCINLMQSTFCHCLCFSVWIPFLSFPSRKNNRKIKAPRKR